MIDTGKPKMLEFGVADETAWRVGLSCGGRIKVYVERLRLITDGSLCLKTLNAERRARRAVDRSSPILADGARPHRPRRRCRCRSARRSRRQSFRTGNSGAVEADGRSFFLNVHLPQPRLVVIGAVHISQALAPMARMAGYPVEIIDPRTAFATRRRFPDVDALCRNGRRTC